MNSKVNTREAESETTPFGHYWLCLTAKRSERQGRANRREFWWFMFFEAMFSLLLLGVALLFDPLVRSLELAPEELPIPVLWLVLGGLFGVATASPLHAVAVRRMHDWGQSGNVLYMCFLPSLIAGIGFVFVETSHASKVFLTLLPYVLTPIIFIVLLSVRSNAGPNKYGPQP